MIRRLGAVGCAAALLVTACNAGESTTMIATSDPTVGAATTTTVVATTAPGALPASRLGAGTPPVELDAYRASARLEVEAEEFSATIESSGIRVSESFDCLATYTLRSETSVERVVGDLAGVWHGTPLEVTETTYADPTVAALLELCPVSTRFWGAFDPRSLNQVTATGIDTVNGVVAFRYDLTDAITDFRAVEVVPAFDGLELLRLEVWRERGDGWIARMVVDVAVDPDLLSVTLGLPELAELTTAGVMSMTVDITSPDDPSLRVSVPR